MIDLPPTAADLAEENCLLRQRVAELEHRAEHLERKLQYAEAFLHDAFEAIPFAAFLFDPERAQMVGVNVACARLTGRPAEEWVGRTVLELFPPEQAAGVEERYRACLAAGAPLEYEERLLFPNGELWVRTIYSPVPNAEGRMHRIFGIAFDITEQKRRELEARQHQEAMIERQSEMLTALSTPLLQISKQVVVMPLIGAIDSGRSRQIMEMLLHGVASSRAAVAILDITGVTVVDTHVADTLIQAAQAARLLGTRVILTGIRPEIAQLLVDLGVELGGIVTRSSLQGGIAYAIGRN